MTIKETVAAGAAWMDKVSPDWHMVVDTDVLDVADNQAEAEIVFGDGFVEMKCGCVLGQVFVHGMAVNVLDDYEGDDDGDRATVAYNFHDALEFFSKKDGYDDVENAFMASGVYASPTDETDSDSDASILALIEEFDEMNAAWTEEIQKRLAVSTKVAHS